MKKKTQLKIVLGVICISVFVILIGYFNFGEQSTITNDFNLNMPVLKDEDNNIKISTTSGEFGDPPATTSEQFIFYRDVMLDMFNITLDYYDSLSPNDTKIANNYIYAIWGYDNGTLTKEEAQALTYHNSPLTWFDVVWLWPLESSMPLRNDKGFRVAFRTQAQFAERCTQVDVYLDKNGAPWDFSENSPTVQHLNTYEVDDEYHMGHNSGNSWVADSWYFWPEMRYGIWGLGFVGFEAYGQPGYIDDWVKFVVRYKWQFLDIWDGWVNQPMAYNHYNLMGIIPLDHINIFDDDLKPPELIPGQQHTWIYDDNGNPIQNPSHNYYDDDVIILSADFWEDSGFYDVNVKIDGIEIPKLQYTWNWEWYSGYLGSRRIYIYLLFPGLYYDLGSHTASFSVTDNDNDRNGDRLTSLPTPIQNFYIYDDDTSPPQLSDFTYGSLYDNETYIKVKFHASDPSGIYPQFGVFHNIDGSDLELFDIYTENSFYCVDLTNPHEPGYYSAFGVIWDNDYDRVLDRRSRIFNLGYTVVDDDTTPPDVSYFNDWEIFDSDYNLEIILEATDASGIYSVYATFAGTDYPYYQIDANGRYHIFIPNPRSLGSFPVDIFVNDGDYDGWDRDREQFTETLTFTVIDDDITAPEINIEYKGGTGGNMGTDSKPGYWWVYIVDDKSGIGEMVISVDGYEVYKHTGTSDGAFFMEVGVSNSLGAHNISVSVKDADRDRGIIDQESSNEYYEVFISDDDTTPPDVSYFNNWEIFDGEDHLEIILEATDVSGIYNVYATFAGTDYVYDHIDADGRYHILVPNPHALGTYTVDIWVSDDDYDGWVGDRELFTETLTFTVNDDDIIQPDVSYFNNWEIFDSEDHLEIILEVTDISGIYSVYATYVGTVYTYDHIDANGRYHILIPNPIWPGTYAVDIWVSDNDYDGWVGDRELFTETLTFTVIDDDTNAPVITYEYTGDGTDGNPGTLIVSASDNSGLSIDPSGTYPVPNTLGMHPFFFTASDNDNDRWLDSLSESIFFFIVIIDDDTTAPIINYIYTGDGTDGNPGTIIVSASDNSGLLIDPSGTYPVPSTLGMHPFFFTAFDNDNDREGDILPKIIYFFIEIIDDDTTAPVITYEYTGDGTDGNSGTIVVSASDDSGLSFDPSGTYSVPSALGTHEFTFSATDNDNDWSGDMLTTTITVLIDIIDDDTIAPVIVCEYTGDGTDGNPGTIIVYVSDASGLSIDPSGTYDVPSALGTHIFAFSAGDNDNDRAGDILSTSISFSIDIIDDDIITPVITYVYTGDGTDGNPGTIVVSASDDFGLSIDPSGTYDVPSALGTHIFAFSASDNDNDREGDILSTSISFSIDIIDDDITPPTIYEPILGNPIWSNDDILLPLIIDAFDASGFSSIEIIIGSYTSYELGPQDAILLPGIYTLEITVIDGDNDRTGDSLYHIDTFTIILDLTAPITTATSSGTEGFNSWYTSDVTVTLSATDDVSGVAYTEYLIDDGLWETYSISLPITKEGTTTVSFRSFDNVGNSEDVESIMINIDKTTPTTTLTFEPYSGEAPLFYVSTTTEFVLTTVDNPFGSGVDIIQYRIGEVGDWNTYTVGEPFTISDIGGPYTVYYNSMDVAGNVEGTKSVIVIVNAAELTYTGEVSGVYSDPVILEAELIDVATTLGIEGKIIVFTIGTQSISAETNSSGIAQVILILEQPWGDYFVSVSFAGDGQYLASSDEDAFTINKEYAYAEYTGDTVIPTTVDAITLRATVFDEDDGNWGNLSKIYVNFTIFSENYVLLESHLEWVELTIVEGVGVVIIEIDNYFAESAYLVRLSFNPDDNDYYWGPLSDPVTLIIYEPTGDFITGGGWIEDTEGNKGNFGFNVKYRKNGLPRGNAIYVYRDGEYVYIIKVNAWTGMAIIGDNNYSIFEAKCNVKQINATTGEIIWSEGNYKLRIEVWDHSQDGKDDVFQITVYDKIGLIYHVAGFDPYGILGGGNIVIHIDEKK